MQTTNTPITLISHINIASMDGTKSDPLGLISNAYVLIQDGKFLDISQERPKPTAFDIEINGSGNWMLPGFIDCHTHLVYGGNRAKEYALRAAGASYEEIAKSGGGILSTVNATRAANMDELEHNALKRARILRDEGVSHIEVKSGYGLELETELKQLRVAEKVAGKLKMGLSKTLLAAHAVPPEFKDNSDHYVDYIIDTIIPAAIAEDLVDAVDMFCESIAFSKAQCERLIQACLKHQLAFKAHSDQIRPSGLAISAAQHGALSIDHAEQLTPLDVAALANAKTSVVLLPGAYYTLRDTQLPPINALREAGINLAVATDLNSGSSPIASLLLAANMAVTLFRLSCEEVLLGITRNAATALGIDGQKGIIKQGHNADFSLWAISHPTQMLYEVNQHKPYALFINGENMHG